MVVRFPPHTLERLHTRAADRTIQENSAVLCEWGRGARWVLKRMQSWTRTITPRYSALFCG